MAMVEDARTRLAGRQITLERRFWMWGFPASGSFVSRFVHLHPEVVKAASIGSPGFGPPVPLAEWKGRTLEYPAGIADLEQLTGAKFNLDAFRQVPLHIYVGDDDVNIVAWWTPATEPDLGLLDALFGGPANADRWPGFETAYLTAGAHCVFQTYPGVEHSLLPRSVYADFFERYRRDPAPAPAAKPLAYRLVFPHVACSDGWDTEVNLVYTVEGGPANGDLEAYRAEGGTALQKLAVRLPPGATRTISACREFAAPAQMTHLRFLSDTRNVTGYARFTRQGRTATAAANAGGRLGLFPGLDITGTTILALANLETETAAIALTGLDEAGAAVTAAQFQAPPRSLTA